MSDGKRPLSEKVAIMTQGQQGCYILFSSRPIEPLQQACRQGGPCRSFGNVRREDCRLVPSGAGLLDRLLKQLWKHAAGMQGRWVTPADPGAPPPHCS